MTGSARLSRIARASAIALLLAASETAFAEGRAVEVPVPRVVILPGAEITEEQLVGKSFKPSIVRAEVHLERAGLIGKVARRVLPAGRPVPLIAVKDAEPVVMGQPVVIAYVAEGIEILARAMPLQSGKLNEVISCRNMDSGVVVQAKVVGPGHVQVEGN